MSASLAAIWTSLTGTPLFGLTLTLLAYLAALRLYRATGGHPLANPVLTACTALIALLSLAGIPFERYFSGAQFLHFLLGPATVALAVPLYLQFRKVKTLLRPIAIGLLAGSVTAAATAVAIARWLGAGGPTQLSLAPKSVTTPIAMGIAERLGGIPSLTAAIVIVTGIFGAVIARPLFDALKVTDPAIRGFALGVAAHGVGTARAFQLDIQSGAFAALAMGLNGLLSALVLPLVCSGSARLCG